MYLSQETPAKEEVVKVLVLVRGPRRGRLRSCGSDSQQRSCRTREQQPITGQYLTGLQSLPLICASISLLSSTAKPEWREVHVEKI